MLLENVDSSNIASVGWGATILAVKFANGSTYLYVGVPEMKYQKFLAAESMGRFLNLDIKPHYDFTQLEMPEPKEEHLDKKYENPYRFAGDEQC